MLIDQQTENLPILFHTRIGVDTTMQKREKACSYRLFSLSWSSNLSSDNAVLPFYSIAYRAKTHIPVLPPKKLIEKMHTYKEKIHLRC